jgi:hypothetical protein
MDITEAKLRRRQRELYLIIAVLIVTTLSSLVYAIVQRMIAVETLEYAKRMEERAEMVERNTQNQLKMSQQRVQEVIQQSIRAEEALRKKSK